MQSDMKYIYSVGQKNGIYKWSFYGDLTFPEAIEDYCEETLREREGFYEVEESCDEKTYTET